MDSLPDALVALLGRDHVSLDAAALDCAYSPWTRLGAPRAVLRPNSTEQVAAVMRLAHAARAPVVAWGGRTGLV
ncbi:MAG TPA: FAD-binding protein, partial [Phenylobacterium sp.]|nr:FAD-binding protein [Phenylobacterium sp.]